MYSDLVFYYENIGKNKNVAIFSVFKICRHLPFLPNFDHSFMAPLLIKLAEKVIGSPNIKEKWSPKRGNVPNCYFRHI
jgi:hypothetical protein